MDNTPDKIHKITTVKRKKITTKLFKIKQLLCFLFNLFMCKIIRKFEAFKLIN
jgi:hypothetical protein